jgi:acyl dehydratase
MPLNLDAVGAVSEPVERSWDSNDSLLYAVGVGAGSLDPFGLELEFTTENSKNVEQQVLPTYGVLLGSAGGGLAALGTWDWANFLVAGIGIELAGPLPVEGTVSVTSEVMALYDKGNAAVAVLDFKAVDAVSHEHRFTLHRSWFIGGEGGWGGDRGPSGIPNQPPDREPDHQVAYSTRPDQGLTYRLNGDRNPLHSDPEFAKQAGFPTPILHGLCTFGFVGRALLHTLCGSDPARFLSMDARLSKPVFAGDTLTTSMWVDGDSAVFRTKTDRGEAVLDGGLCRFRP